MSWPPVMASVTRRLALEDQRQRAGPEGGGELARGRGNVARPGIEMRGIGQMDDQRMVLRPPLGGEDLRHGLRIGGIGTEAVDRLGGKGDQFAGAQQLGRASQLTHR